MSGYNLLEVWIQCPRCGSVGLATAEFRFGLFEFRDYKIGDRLEWGDKGYRFPRRRPSNGDFDGEGYVECQFCGRDYWVLIGIRADIIASTSVDPTKQGYIPDSDHQKD